MDEYADCRKSACRTPDTLASALEVMTHGSPNIHRREERASDRQQLNIEKEFANAIIDTVRDALVVLDADLFVREINASFCRLFKVSREETVGNHIYSLGNGQWNAPQLRQLLEEILPNNKSFENFRVEHDFPDLGMRTMRLNARRIDHLQLILLAIEDTTGRERAKKKASARETRLRLALQAGMLGMWDWNPRTNDIVWDDREYELFGLSPETIQGPVAEVFFRLVHPEDHDEVVRVLNEASTSGMELRHEFRIIRPDGETRWISAFGKAMEAEGGETRLIGVSYDITDRKIAEGRKELLVAELNHRVKNMLSTVQAISAQSMNRTNSMEEFQRQFSGRLKALARGHDILVRNQWQRSELSALLHETLDPYGTADRIAIDCDDIWLEPRAALAFNLIVHELATNAAKYGTLSGNEGRVDIDCHVVDRGEVIFEWRETGGPAVAPPQRKGFGTRLIERSASHELQGAARIDYLPEGLLCTIRFAPGDVTVEPGGKNAA